MRIFQRVQLKSSVIFQICLMLAWGISLLATDAYYSIYTVCVCAGVLCLYDNSRHSHEVVGKKRWILSGASLLFSGAVLLANYSIFLPGTGNWIGMGCTAIGGVLIAWHVLLWLCCHMPYACSDGSRKHPVQFAVIVFLIIVLVDLLHLFFVAYPGNLTPDSLAQIKQLTEGSYTNHHPYWHTVIIKLWLDLGLALFGNMQAAVALYSVMSVVFIAGCFSYAMLTMYQAKVKTGWLVIAGLWYLLAPYHISYSVTMWKDIAFSGAAVLVVVGVYRILKKIGNCVILDYVLLVIGGVGFCVWRSNGWPAMVLMLVVLGIVLRKKQLTLLIVLTAVVLTGWILKTPVLNALDVKQPDTVEAMSIPEQQVARVIYDGGELTPEQRDLINKIIPIEEVPNLYKNYISDPIKGAIRQTNASYFEEHKAEYLKLWIELGLKYPGTYIKAWVDQTKGYWNAGYEYWICAEEITNNTYEISKQVTPSAVSHLSARYFDFFDRNPLAQPFKSVGLHIWILFGLCIVNFVNRRKEWLLTVPIIAIVLTLWVATPVFCEFRYAYAVFTTLPFLLAVTVTSQRKEGENHG